MARTHALTLSRGELRRFVGKFETTPDGCWCWTAAKYDNGYGAFGLRGHVELAHRVAYRAFVGAVPVNFQIDHLCRNKSCVNPAHLEAVEPKINTLRASPIVRANQCRRGHELTPENIIFEKNGHRRCRICRLAEYRRKAADPEWREKKNAKHRAYLAANPDKLAAYRAQERERMRTDPEAAAAKRAADRARYARKRAR